MSRSKGERDDKNIKICQLWGREFMSLIQKYEERVRKFSFLARHYFKAELYCYIYIVIFVKHLPELYWIVLMCFYILNTLLVRKTSNIKPWTGHPPLTLLSLHTRRLLNYVSYAPLRLTRLFAFVPYASSRLRVLHAFAPSRLTCLTHARYLRAMRALFVRVKIVLGWICSPAKSFHFPWIIKGTTNCVVLNKSFNLK